MYTPTPELGSPAVFASVLQAARDAGMDVGALRHLHGARAWRERRRIWEEVMRAVRIDGFPIRVAQRYSPAEIGPLGMIAQVAPDLRAAFRHMLDHQRLLTGVEFSRIRDDDARGVAVYELMAVEGRDLAGRARREMVLASGLNFARHITGVRIRPRRVCFVHASPRDLREHEAFFDCPVVFDAAFDGIEYELRTLALPLPGSDPDVAQFLDAHLSALGGEPPSNGARIEGDVRRVICRRLGDRSVAMRAIALELGTSPRTLRRHLLEQGTSYHEILDRVRHEIADDLLADPSKTLAEVAFALGFSDATSLHRAYVRWTGRTPTAQRPVVRSRPRADLKRSPVPRA